MQVADGIYQVQLPLPFPLKIVNCYVLRDGAGWAIVDTGIHYGPGEAAWQNAFDQIGLQPAVITRIFLTHAHPDHYGMAGWLAQQSAAPVYLSAGEQAFAERAWHNGAANETVSSSFFQAHGMPQGLAGQVQAAMAENRNMTLPWPEITVLAAGTPIEIGGRLFQTIAAPGHSDEHLVFYCAEERLVLCGDAVLAKITPNVSCWPNGRPNPLADFLGSLALLGSLQVELALPGHGPLIREWNGRLGELRAHHAERLDVIERAAGAGKSAFDVCCEVFPTSALSPHQLRFAIAETLAHLEYLVGAGRAERVEQPRLIYRSLE